MMHGHMNLIILYLLVIFLSRIEILSSLLLNVLVSYDVTPCRLVNIYVLFKSSPSSRGSGSRFETHIHFTSLYH